MTAQRDQAVVLVHGLWLSGWTMEYLARHLRRCGYRTHLFSYPTMRRSLRENALALREFSDRVEGSAVHYVGHSLGGVVIQAMFAFAAPARDGRIVTLSSPHGGSRAAVTVARRAWGRRILGESIGSLLRGERVAADMGGRDIGLIKGNLPVGLGRLVVDFPGANDGVVAVDEMHWPGARDEITVRAPHSGMLFSPRVATAICQFLRFGHLVR